MTRSVLCISSSSNSRISHGPSQGEHVIKGSADRSTGAIFTCSCLPRHREVAEAITFSIAQRTPSNSAHKPTRPRSLARSDLTCTSVTLAALAPAASALVAAASAPR